MTGFKTAAKKIPVIFFITFLFYSCIVPELRIEPFLKQKILENRTKEESFNDCLGVLNKNGHVPTSASIEEGLIQTDWIYFNRKKINLYRYRLTIQLSELNNQSTVVVIESHFQRGEPFASRGLRTGSRPHEAEYVGWNDISADSEMKGFVDQFYQDLLNRSFLQEAKSEPVKPTKPQKQVFQKTVTSQTKQDKKRKHKTSLGFALKGGYNYLNIGDLNTWIDSWNYYYEAVITKGGGSVPETLENLHRGHNFGGEISLALSPRWAVSLGVGYTYLKNTSRTILIDGNQNEENHLLTNVAKITPLTIGVYYSFPIFHKTKFFLNTGVGYYFAKLSQDYLYQRYDNYWVEWQKDMSSSDLGFHGGMGFEWHIRKFLSLIFEARGQCVRINSLEGTRKYKNSTGYKFEERGIFYYWVESASEGIGTYRILPEEPDPVWTRKDIREFSLNLSGISLMIGIKIRPF